MVVAPQERSFADPLPLPLPSPSPSPFFRSHCWLSCGVFILSFQQTRQRTASVDSTGVAVAVAESSTHDTSPERFHSATGEMDPAAVAAIAAAAAAAGGGGRLAGGNPPPARGRTHSAESPSTAPPPPPYDPVARSFSYRPPANGERDGVEPPEGCRLA